MNPQTQSSLPLPVRTKFLGHRDGSRLFPGRLCNSAFSLVEVTLALGILAFAGVGVLALLPVALSSLRASSFDTVVTQIATDARADLQQVELDGNAQKVSYYDAEGQPVANAQAVYTAYRSEAIQPIPGAATGSLHRIALQVVHNPGRVTLPVDASGLATIPENFQSRTLRFFVAR